LATPVARLRVADAELVGLGETAQGTWLGDVPGRPGAAPPSPVPAAPERDEMRFLPTLAALPPPGPVAVMPGWMTSLPPVSTEELTWTSTERSGGTAMAAAVMDTTIVRPAVVLSTTRPRVWKASRSAGTRLSQCTEYLRLVSSFLSLLSSLKPVTSLRLVGPLRPVRSMMPVRPIRSLRQIRPVRTLRPLRIMRRETSSSKEAARRAMALSRR
jgi:hypothetical protein